MGAFQKILGLVDALGLFLVTRHPFVELFLLLMRTGDNLPEQSGSIPENFVDTVFRREYFMIYLHSVVYFICGTGMTLDMKRRQCGFAAGVHVAVVTAMTLHGSPKMTEYSMVRFWRNSPSGHSIFIPIPPLWMRRFLQVKFWGKIASEGSKVKERTIEIIS